MLQLAGVVPFPNRRAAGRGDLRRGGRFADVLQELPLVGGFSDGGNDARAAQGGAPDPWLSLANDAAALDSVGDAPPRKTRVTYLLKNVVPAVVGRRGISCFGNSPVNAFRKATRSAACVSLRSLPNWVFAMILTAVSKVLTEPLWK